MQNNDMASFNAIRGIAALAVCASHLRSFLLVEYSLVAHPQYSKAVFYFATGLGHQAVIVFFVLSGWLVGGSVWKKSTLFSWRHYAIARLSRLHVVLVPALLLTFIIDTLGNHVSGGFGYDGNLADVIKSGPAADNPLNLSLLTAFGNLLFLQGIAFPVFGTNGPLWSLANEFWYYVIFPLFVTFKRNLIFMAVGLLLLVILPATISLPFGIWLCGWVGFCARVRPAVAEPLCIVSLIVFAFALAASKLGSLPDGVLAASLTCVLIGLRASPDLTIRWANNFFSYLSRISFTLYVSHFPLLACAFFSFHITPQQPSFATYVEFALILLATVTIATGLWYLFERNTEAVRRMLMTVSCR